MSASTASVAVSKVRRSIRLVSHAVTGEPMHSTIAPKVISRSRVADADVEAGRQSASMPAGASTEQPVTIFPSIKAVGAKRRADVRDFPCKCM